MNIVTLGDKSKPKTIDAIYSNRINDEDCCVLYIHVLGKVNPFTRMSTTLGPSTDLDTVIATVPRANLFSTPTKYRTMLIPHNANNMVPPKRQLYLKSLYKV